MAYPNQNNGINTATAKSAIADAASEIAGKAGSKIEDAMHSAETTMHKMTEQGREAGERVNEVAGNMRSALDKSVSDQPMATLAVAAALGFVIGALWKS